MSSLLLESVVQATFACGKCLESTSVPVMEKADLCLEIIGLAGHLCNVCLATSDGTVLDLKRAIKIELGVSKRHQLLFVGQVFCRPRSRLVDVLGSCGATVTLVQLAGVTCGACGAAESSDFKLRACAACLAEWYCSPGCQKAMWRHHRPACFFGDINQSLASQTA